ncbi:FG-GAP repeat domain-containing protein [candidate division KSB1 bacterium]
MVDTDRDGILDLVSTTYSSGVYRFKGLGDRKYAQKEEFTFSDGKKIDYETIYDISPMFIDWDADGDLDLCGTGFEFLDNGIDQKMMVFMNEGTDVEPQFNREGKEVTTVNGNAISGFKTLNLDWDGDGTFDLVTSRDEAGGGIVWYKNIGTNESPEFADEEFLIKGPEIDMEEIRANYGKETERANESTWPSNRWQTCVADYNDDGKLDILIGDFFDEVTEVRTLTVEEKAAKEELEKEQETADKDYETLYEEYSKIMEVAGEKGIASKDVKIPEELDKKMESTGEEMSRLYRELRKYSTTESKTFGRVWVFLHK